jgi:hypothetical protein
LEQAVLVEAELTQADLAVLILYFQQLLLLVVVEVVHQVLLLHIKMEKVAVQVAVAEVKQV